MIHFLCANTELTASALQSVSVQSIRQLCRFTAIEMYPVEDW